MSAYRAPPPDWKPTEEPERPRVREEYVPRGGLPVWPITPLVPICRTCGGVMEPDRMCHDLNGNRYER